MRVKFCTEVNKNLYTKNLYTSEQLKTTAPEGIYERKGVREEYAIVITKETYRSVLWFSQDYKNLEPLVTTCGDWVLTTKQLYLTIK